jgi:flavin reductase (DIM6/NTAB) family NADH-FMN oxidoreductase RutF
LISRLVRFRLSQSVLQGQAPENEIMEKSYRNWQPVQALPAGLITWYAPGGRPVALVTYWMAMIGGESPRVRASWPGRRDPRSLFWPGGDFILNIPDEKSLPLIRKMVSQGCLCLDVENDLGEVATSGSTVCAPRLARCPCQLECCGGRVENITAEPEVSGHIVLLHLGATEMQVQSGLDLQEINPFRKSLL